MKFWWLSGCHTLVVRAMVAEDSGPVFDSQWLPVFILLSALLALFIDLAKWGEISKPRHKAL